MIATVFGVIERAQLIEVDREALVRGQVAVGHGRAAEVLDLRLVDREAGVRVEHLLAGVHDGLQELLMTGLPPVITTTLSGESSMPRAEPRSSASASRSWGMPAARAVARVAVGDRPVHRVHDVRGRGNVDVAQVEGVHAVSLRLPSGGGLRDAEGGLGAQTVEPVGELLHAVLSASN